ncbi:FAD-dependent monooxygenase [Polynucleobacter rarus]|uniref:FAD-dependent monooxygenase n=1 Tax=Polynucleobacter rarus TaxID=556055 RepID=UPI001B869C23|nr:FAD-dependent monooxygenase [Polynucleobacter rarus]
MKNRIGIIGAGIGGMTLAALLQKRGFEVSVFEQASKFARVGAGIQQSANAVKVLRDIGLEDHFRNTAFCPQTWSNREWDTGAMKHELTLGSAYEEKYGAPYFLLHRGDLHEAITSKVDPNSIHLQKKLKQYTNQGDSVKLDFEDGSTNEVDALIGADGIHSRIREQMLGADQPRFTGRVAYRTTFPASLMNGYTIDDCTKWWGIDRHIVIYYVTPQKDEIYFVTSVPEPQWNNESWSAKGDLGELRAAFSGFHEQVQRVLAACPDVHKWSLCERDPLPTWCDQRVVLMGDACHPMVPYMAQGAAMAIEDAAVLTRVLEQEQDIPVAFKEFEALRKERTSKVQLTSHKNQWMSQRTDSDWVYGYDAWAVEV